MKRLLLLTVLLMLVWPGAPAAKELASVTVCGASGCRTIDNPRPDAGQGGDGISDAAPAPAPYYTVELTTADDVRKHRWRIFFVPEPPLVAFPQEDGRIVFDRVEGAVLEALRRLASGVEPYAAPRITSARVGGKHVAEAAGYATLFTIDGDDAPLSSAYDFVPVILRSTRPSPWTDLRYLMFSPTTGALERGTRLIELPGALASAVAAGASLEAAEDSGGAPGTDDRVLVLVILGTVVALLGAAVLAGRRLRTAAVSE